MPPRKLVTGALLAAGALVGPRPLRRRAARKRERVDLYADDGSMHSFGEGTVEADRLLPIAHELLAPGWGGTSSAGGRAPPPPSRATSCSARAAARATTSTSTASRRAPMCWRRSARRSP